MPEMLWDLLRGFWAVLAEMAPWLVMGFAFAGVLWVFVKPAWVARHLSAPGSEDGGKNRRSRLPGSAVVKASLMGVPLPLCSCGVIPVGTSLHKQGASQGASASFLISTPQTGVDSILATYALMGPVFAVVRPVVALVSGVLGGWLVDAVVVRESPSKPRTPEKGACASSACCDPSSDDWAINASWLGKLKAAARYGFVTLPADLVRSLFVGLVLAAMLTSLLDGDALAAWFGGPWGVLFAVLLGIPIYVCSTGSIPIAVALLAVGASPGAALAFLIAGPATNAATIAVVGGALGRRTTVAYAASVLVTAIASGYALNVAVAAGLSLRLPESVTHLHQHGLTRIDHAWAVALLLLMVVGWGARRGWWANIEPQAATKGKTEPEQLELAVDGMNCSHCVGSVEGAIKAVPGVSSVVVDLPGKRATVAGVALDRDALAAAISAAGFRVPG
ncbi:MAG: SO_0444 family Cu/Zn efflux transporter [Planctomycetota bacterium]